MLNIMRNTLKYSKWILMIIVLSFILFWGVDWWDPGQRRGADQWIARVDGADIDIERWQNRVRALDTQYRRMFGQQYEQLRGNLKLAQNAAEQEIESILIARDAERLGLAVTDDELSAAITSIPSSTSLGGGSSLQKSGDEQYLLLSDKTAQTNIPAGTYFIAVVSEGQNPASGTIVTNSCGYVLTSFGLQPRNQSGNLAPVGPDISLSDTLLGGEVKHYQFTVSPDVLAMEVRLDNRVANPRMTLRADGLPVTSSTTYGRDAGVSYTWLDDHLINIATPSAGTYTMAVQAESYTGGYSNAARSR